MNCLSLAELFKGCSKMLGILMYNLSNINEILCIVSIFGPSLRNEGSGAYVQNLGRRFGTSKMYLSPPVA